MGDSEPLASVSQRRRSCRFLMGDASARPSSTKGSATNRPTTSPAARRLSAAPHLVQKRADGTDGSAAQRGQAMMNCNDNRLFASERYARRSDPKSVDSRPWRRLSAAKGTAHDYRRLLRTKPGREQVSEKPRMLDGPYRLRSGRWLCGCGRRHRSYVTRCKCGFDKSVRPERWTRECGRRHRTYITRRACGFVRRELSV